MNKRDYQKIKETVYHEKLDNGLDVYIIPKPGFNKKYATFTTKYGSIDNTFVPLGQDEMKTVPDGIAHFLEHKMFASEDGDVFNIFTKYGANSNAFTSFNRTAYLFSCTDFFNENLTTLMDFVQEVYLTDENVEKEKGIIAQEIKMYEDNADWQLFFGAIKNMFKENNVRIDIAGTVESISTIDKELLLECYHTFYHPSNMVLCIVGDVDVENTIELVKSNQAKKTFDEPQELVRNYKLEDNTANDKDLEIKMPVQNSKVIMGVKGDRQERQGEELLKYELSIATLLDYLFDDSSEFKEELVDEKIINSSFTYECTFEYSFGFVLISGDTKDPQVFIDKIKNKLLSLDSETITEEDFRRIKNKSIGGFLSSLNSPEFIANQFTRYNFNGIDLFEVLDILEELTLDDINNAKKFFEEHAFTTVKILPEEI